MSPKSDTAKENEAILRKRRIEYIGRHGFTCQFCGGEFQGFILHHKLSRNSARLQVHKHDPTNLVAVCGNCHLLIHDDPELTASVAEDFADIENGERLVMPIDYTERNIGQAGTDIEDDCDLYEDSFPPDIP